MATSDRYSRTPQNGRTAPASKGISKSASTLKQEPAGRSGGRAGKRRKRTTKSGCMTCLTVASFTFVIGIIILLLGAAYAVMTISNIAGDLPTPESVVLPPAKETTKIFAADGTKLADLFIENRNYAKINEIPGHLQEAFVAVEDERFYKHRGVDIEGIVRSAIKLIRKGHIAGGASTLTMQLARNSGLVSREVSWSRKIKEAFVALAMERKYTKAEILERYLNQVYFGHGAYGVKTAGEIYFGKDIKDLTVAEGAMLAAVLKSPGDYSPFINPPAAIKRRNAVLLKMLELRFITNSEYYDAIEQDIKLVKLRGPSYENYRSPYFVTYIMDLMLDENGDFRLTPQDLYTQGYQIHTTLNMEMQYYADRAVINGVIAGNLYLAPGRTGSDNAMLNFAMSRDMRIMGIKSEAEYNQLVDEMISEYCNFCASGEKDPGDRLCSRLLEPIQAMSNLKRDGNCYARGSSRISLEQIINARQKALSTIRVEQGALSAVNSRTGEILAMVGGVDYQKYKYNHAWQAQRQPGSSFKPFAYLTALKQGYSMESSVSNSRLVIGKYSPRNYGGSYGDGRTMSFRSALVFSMNVPAVRVGQLVGTEKIVELCRDLGITGHMEPTPSLPLGTASISPLEMSLAYAAIANGGYRVNPVAIKEIRNVEGTVVYKHDFKQGKRVLDDNMVARITPVMQEVMTRGTGTRAQIGREAAGKTGTTSNFKDAWFVGFTPDIATAVWLGNDDNLPMCTTADKMGGCGGAHMPGGHIPAPIWRDFMKHASAIQGFSKFELPETTAMKHTYVGGGGRRKQAEENGAIEGAEPGSAPGATLPGEGGADRINIDIQDGTGNRPSVYDTTDEFERQDRQLNQGDQRRPRVNNEEDLF